MKNLGKRAQQSPFMMLVIIVCAVMIILILLVIFKTLHDRSEEAALRNRCKASVQMYAKYSNIQVPFGEDTAAEAEINCPTRYVTVSTDEPDNMREEVADMMVNCWDDFGRGRTRLFTAQDEKFCVMCSVFQFEDSDTRLTGLPSYLMTQRSGYREDGRDLTYYEFLQGYKTSDAVVDEAKRGADLSYLEGDKRYAVMFTFYKKSYWSQVERAMVGGGIGLAGSIVGVVLIAGTGGLGTPIGVMVIGGSLAAGAAVGAGTADSTSGVMHEGADWDANVVIGEYQTERLEQLGCEALPVSQLDERFR